MKRYIAQRLFQGAILLCMVTTIVFFLGRLTGNPVDMMLPEDATAEDRDSMIAALGLDGPLHTQFLIFIGNALQGDLGNSIRMRQPAVEVFFDRLPNTLAIIPWAILMAMVIGIPLGVVAALNRGNFIDRLAGGVAVIGVATPNFWLGILLIFIFSVELGWLPSGRMGGPEHYVLPVVTMGMFLIAGFMRLVRSSMLEVMDSEFIKLARIKGMSETVVIWKHCLRNALIPVLTLVALQLGGLFSGAALTEAMFAWRGMGRLILEAILGNDYNLALVCLMFVTATILIANIFADIAYTWLDPRISLGKRRR